MKQFEYVIVDLDERLSRNSAEKVTKAINKLAKRGWELIYIEEMNYTFKREKNSENKDEDIDDILPPLYSRYD